jgi:hypothetical protein
MLRNGVRFSMISAFLALAIAATAQGPWNWDISVEARLRGETRADRDFSKALDDHRGDGFGRLRVGIHLYNPEQGITFFLVPQEAYDQYWTPTCNDNEQQFDLFEGWGQWVSPNDGMWSLRGGRQILELGAQRLVGSCGWANTGLSFDAARVDYESGGWHLTGFGGTIGVRGKNPAHPDLYGLYSTWGHSCGVIDAYCILKHDAVCGMSIDTSTVGARYKAERGPFTLEAEAAAQFGKSAGRDIEAGAAAVNASYAFACGWDPKLGVELVWASGGDPSGSKVKTFDQLYGNNHGRYGIIDYQGLRNVRALNASLSVKPAAKWSAAVSYWKFELDDEYDYWYGAGGGANSGVMGPFRDPTGTAGRDVGDEFDLVLTYAPNTIWNVQVGVAHFIPGSFVDTLNTDNDPSDWGYLQVTWWYR